MFRWFPGLAAAFGSVMLAQVALAEPASTVTPRSIGTLVHEIVHPFMRADFPACAAWFNEGLASLYEQSSDRGGHIQGLVNWRFKGLEKAIKEGRLISFRELTAMTDDEFYGRTQGGHYSDHYAQARYLCYYLQEKGLLTTEIKLS